MKIFSNVAHGKVRNVWCVRFEQAKVGLYVLRSYWMQVASSENERGVSIGVKLLYSNTLCR